MRASTGRGRSLMASASAYRPATRSSRTRSYTHPAAWRNVCTTSGAGRACRGVATSPPSRSRKPSPPMSAPSSEIFAEERCHRRPDDACAYHERFDVAWDVLRLQLETPQPMKRSNAVRWPARSSLTFTERAMKQTDSAALIALLIALVVGMGGRIRADELPPQTATAQHEH